MGLDVQIYFKTKTGDDPDLPDWLPNDFNLYKADEDSPVGATHEIQTCVRFYGVGYERGPWPLISSVLMTLLACKDIEVVWYDSDSEGVEDMEVMTPKYLSELTGHYLAYRHGVFE